jgi:beta-mannosidase
MTAEAHYELVKSAATGGFNTLRVWGAICCANNR